MKNKILFSILLFMAIFTSCEKEPQIVKRAIELHELETFGDSVKLSWDINNKNIKTLLLRRIALNSEADGSSIIYKDIPIANLSTTTYTDSNLPLKKYIKYQLIGSKLETIDEYGNSDDLIYSDVKEHEQKDLNIINPILIINSIFCEEINTAFFIGLNSGGDYCIKSYNYDMQVEKEIIIKGVDDCRINKNGSYYELIVLKYHGEVAIYDAQTLIEKENIALENYDIQRVIIKDDLMFCYLHDYSKKITVYKRSTREKLSDIYDNNNNINYYDNFQFIPNSEYEFIASNRYYIFYCKIDKNGNKVKSYEYDLPYECNKKFSIFPKSNKIIIAPNGLILSKEFQTITSLSSGNYNFSDFAINSSETKIYAACAKTNEIKVYDANNFTLLETIKTKGTPSKISYYNGEIISISKVNVFYDNYDYLIEKIKHQ